MRMRVTKVALGVTATLAATMATAGPAGAIAPHRASTTVPLARTIARGLVQPGGWREPSGLYLSTDTAGTDIGAPQTLRRVDPTTGRLEATVSLRGAVVDVTETPARLWVAVANTFTRPLIGAVVELNPVTLRTVHRQPLPDAGAGLSVQLAAAGGWLWAVDGPDLLRIDPSTGVINKTIVAAGERGASFEAVGAGPRGRTLVVSVADGSGLARVQRRDPVTGVIVAESAPINGVGLQSISVADNGAWLSVATGTEGYVSRLSLTTMRPTPTPAVPQEPNSIRATVYAGVLYVTGPGGSPSYNYCGNAVTGMARATLPAVEPGYLLTAGASGYYYVPDRTGPTHRVKVAPVPAPCR